MIIQINLRCLIDVKIKHNSVEIQENGVMCGG